MSESTTVVNNFSPLQFPLYLPPNIAQEYALAELVWESYAALRNMVWSPNVTFDPQHAAEYLPRAFSFSSRFRVVD